MPVGVPRSTSAGRLVLRLTPQALVGRLHAEYRDTPTGRLCNRTQQTTEVLQL